MLRWSGKRADIDGSAAQPRIGTAPNALREYAPVFRRNSRRPCRFDKARSRRLYRDGMLTMFFSCDFPLRDPFVQAAVRSLSAMLAPLNIVYNTFPILFIIIENILRAVIRPRRAGGHLPIGE